MRSRVACIMVFPPANFQLAMPFRSQLRVRHGQTDGRRDRQRSSLQNAPPVGGIIIKDFRSLSNSYFEVDEINELAAYICSGVTPLASVLYLSM